MEELKPCPFCGENNNVCDRWLGSNSYDVWCVHCSASINGNSREEAIIKWNTREQRSK